MKSSLPGSRGRPWRDGAPRLLGHSSVQARPEADPAATVVGAMLRRLGGDEH